MKKEFKPDEYVWGFTPVDKLQAGDIVRAEKHLDPGAADILPGTIGVVFGEQNFYGDNCGPIVRWIPNMEVCNVYDMDVSISTLQHCTDKPHLQIKDYIRDKAGLND